MYCARTRITLQLLIPSSLSFVSSSSSTSSLFSSSSTSFAPFSLSSSLSNLHSHHNHHHHHDHHHHYLNLNQCIPKRPFTNLTSTQTETGLLPLGKHVQIPEGTLYTPGQVFLHKLFGYRCIVVDSWVADVLESSGPNSLPPSTTSPYILSNTLKNSNTNNNNNNSNNNNSNSNDLSSETSQLDDSNSSLQIAGKTTKFKRSGLLKRKNSTVVKTSLKKRNYYIAVADERDRRATYSNTPYLFVAHEDIMPYTPVSSHVFQFGRFNEWFQIVPVDLTTFNSKASSSSSSSSNPNPNPTTNTTKSPTTAVTPTKPNLSFQGAKNDKEFTFDETEDTSPDSTTANEVFSTHTSPLSSSSTSSSSSSSSTFSQSSGNSSRKEQEEQDEDNDGDEEEEPIQFSTDKGYPFDEKAISTKKSSLSQQQQQQLSAGPLTPYQYVKYVPTQALQTIRSRNAIIGLYSKVYIQTTRDIRVTAIPWYFGFSMGHNSYIWTCNIIIENLGKSTVRLRRRHWTITDSSGRLKEISGLGVAAGLEPILGPSSRTAFEYTTGIDLQTSQGNMKGMYEFDRIESTHTSSLFVDVPCFVMEAPP